MFKNVAISQRYKRKQSKISKKKLINYAKRRVKLNYKLKKKTILKCNKCDDNR